MQIPKITLYTQRNKFHNTRPTFQSNREHEAMLRALRMAEAEDMKKRFERLNELFNYEIKDNGCHNMAQFTLNFVCAIKNNSEHNLEEFFASEAKANELRKNLTPECQKNSLEIRQEIQAQPVFKDPLLALISANEMKEFVPDENFMKDKRFKPTIDAAKKTYIQVIRNANKDKFNDYEKETIEELVKIMENSQTLNFGEQFEQKLAMLLDSIKHRKADAEKVLVKQKFSISRVLNKIL